MGLICGFTGHIWDYFWDKNVRICTWCSKIEKIAK